MFQSAVDRNPRIASAVIVGLLGLVMPSQAPAQQAVIPLQLSFSDPGARSAGLGGAFVALGDDATAAFANPAGLVQLLKPEISIETRNWSHSIPYTASGRIEGVPSGIGLDVAPGIIKNEATYNTTGLSFLSLVWPTGDWSFALYRHQYADLEFSGETQGLFGGSDGSPERWSDQQMHSTQDVISYGLSAGYRLSDKFSVGLGLTYYDVRLEALTQEYLWDDDSDTGLFGPTTFLPDRLALTEYLFIDDEDWTLSGGFLWSLTSRWRIGGVYRQGFDVSLGNDIIAGVAVDYGVPPGTVFIRNRGVPTEFPDVYGLGVSYRTLEERLTLSFQWDRIEYSSIPRSIELDDQTIDDAEELHFGAEYFFLESSPVMAVRLGAWLDPYHQMYAIVDDPYMQAVLPPGSDEWHYTAGLGFATQRFQVDLAADLSDALNTISLSAIFNF
ncbi:MAG: outer membrane protein transport protein [Gammaproteobacteria bacterium]|nr:outer membrane protein transport protein [Gammaproteobacteria bacterium]MDH5240899.1 outer membrane protein transport protein [Gammaproteobacteria bacterium]MDH5618999.1 outer membrane protein transport protein [Gammaproteobacteria bacterium]